MLVDWEIDYRPYCTDELSDWIEQYVQLPTFYSGRIPEWHIFQNFMPQYN